jgi:hypothetical protein
MYKMNQGSDELDEIAGKSGTTSKGIHRFHAAQNRYSMAVTVTVSIIGGCV